MPQLHVSAADNSLSVCDYRYQVHMALLFHYLGAVPSCSSRKEHAAFSHDFSLLSTYCTTPLGRYLEEAD